MISDIEKLENAQKKFKPDPKSPYTYKSPRVKDPLKSRRPGRPVGTKKKRPNRNESLDSSETSLEVSDINLDSSDDDFTLEPENELEINPTPKTPKEVNTRLRRRLEKEKSTGNENIELINDVANDAHEKDQAETNKKEKNFACNLCKTLSKSVDGVRAHYIADHIWHKFAYSPIMKQDFGKNASIFSVSKVGNSFAHVVPYVQGYSMIQKLMRMIIMHGNGCKFTDLLILNITNLLLLTNWRRFSLLILFFSREHLGNHLLTMRRFQKWILNYLYQILLHLNLLPLK